MSQPGRLRRKADFDRIFRRGQRLGSQWLSLRACPWPEADPRVPLLLAIVTSKRLGGAVVRNRIRRRVRAAIRPLLPRVTGSWAVVALPRAEVATMPWGQLQGAIEQLLIKGGVIGENG